jgi:carbonic anhydrase
MSITDEYLRNNESYAQQFRGPLPLPPSKHLAVLACMDARLDVYRILGLNPGEAHVIRNAGGIADEGAIRSLVISQRLLATTSILLIHHTDCGMLTFDESSVRSQIKRDVGFAPSFALGAFDDLDEDVRSTMRRLQAEPLLPHRDSIRGFVFDVATGRLREVESPYAGAR